MTELYAAADLIMRYWHLPDAIVVLLGLNHLELLGLSALVKTTYKRFIALVKWLSRRFRK